MFLDANDTPRVYLKDGTSGDLTECTIVYPVVRLSPVIEVQRADDLAHIVQWAYENGYGRRGLSLTVCWSQEELEEEFGCQLCDGLLDAAQEWLDATGGGRAASLSLRLWEEVMHELKREFTVEIASAQHPCGDHHDT